MGMAAILVTWPGTFEQTFFSPILRSLHMKFEFNWPSGFRGEDVWKCWRTTDDRRQTTDDGRTTDDGVTGILIAHLGAFGSGELIMKTSVSYPFLYCQCNTPGIDIPEASSIMRALSGARCTDVRLYTLWIKIGTNQRALGEHSHYWTRPSICSSIKCPLEIKAGDYLAEGIKLCGLRCNPSCYYRSTNNGLSFRSPFLWHSLKYLKRYWLGW